MEYDLINDALKRAAIELDAAEVHGVLTGLLCAQDQTVEDKWFQYCFPQAEPGDLLFQETARLLKEMISEVQTQLQHSEFKFYPLLPDEDSSLLSRVEALAFWCQGFLLGISLGGIVNSEKLPGELPEFIKDMVEFSKEENVELEEEEQDEDAYMELVEYIRMGILLFYEEIRSLKGNGSEPTLH